MKELKWYALFSEIPMAVLVYITHPVCFPGMYGMRLALTFHLSLQLVKYMIWPGMCIVQSHLRLTVSAY